MFKMVADMWDDGWFGRSTLAVAAATLFLIGAVIWQEARTPCLRSEQRGWHYVWIPNGQGGGYPVLQPTLVCLERGRRW